MRGRVRPWMLIALLSAAVCGVYAPALRGPFILDDEQFVQKNRWVHQARFDKIFTTSVTDGAGVVSNFYRPLQQSVFALVWRVFGENTTAFHLLSIMTHAANAALFCFLLRALALSWGAALVGAGFWALHPVQSEAVAFVSGYADVLGVCWLLIAMLLAASARERISWGRLALIGAALFLAQLSKESLVVAAPLMLMLWAYGRGTKALWRMTALAAALVATALAAVYLVLKFTVFDFTKVGGLTSEHNVYTAHLWVRLWTFVHVVPEYLKLLVWPKELFYTKPYTGFVDWAAWPQACAGLAVVAAVLGGAACAMRRAPRVALGLLWAAAAIVPFTGVVPMNAMYLEHWLYLPSMGFAVALAAMLSRENAGVVYKIGLLATVVVCAVFGVRTASRAAEWADYERFYLNELAHGGNTAMVCNNLAMYYAEHAQPAKAKEFYVRAARLMPRPEPLYNLSTLLINEGRYADAQEALREALRRDPGFAPACQRIEALDAYLRQR